LLLLLAVFSTLWATHLLAAPGVVRDFGSVRSGPAIEIASQARMRGGILPAVGREAITGRKPRVGAVAATVVSPESPLEETTDISIDLVVVREAMRELPLNSGFLSREREDRRPSYLFTSNHLFRH
jgi:hypothetical protein